MKTLGIIYIITIILLPWFTMGGWGALFFALTIYFPAVVMSFFIKSRAVNCPEQSKPWLITLMTAYIIGCLFFLDGAENGVDSIGYLKIIGIQGAGGLSDVPYFFWVSGVIFLIFIILNIVFLYKIRKPNPAERNQ